MGGFGSELCPSDPWQEGAECPTFLRLLICGTGESTGTVGIGQGRCRKLRVPLRAQSALVVTSSVCSEHQDMQSSACL